MRKIMITTAAALGALAIFCLTFDATLFNIAALNVLLNLAGGFFWGW